MELSVKKQNVFSEYTNLLKPIKAKKVLVLNNVIKVVIEKQKENCLIVDLDDTFTIKEYIEKFEGKDFLDDTQKYIIKRNSVTRSFNLLSKEKELSDFLKKKLTTNSNESTLTLKKYIKKVHGDKIVKNEVEYNKLSDEIFSEFIKYAIKKVPNFTSTEYKLKVEKNKSEKMELDKIKPSKNDLNEHKLKVEKNKLEKEELEKNKIDELPTLQPLLKSWRFIV
jgi:hypothetical protein